MSIQPLLKNQSASNINFGKSTPWHIKLLRIVLKIQDIFHSAMSSLKTRFRGVKENDEKILANRNLKILNNRELLKDDVIREISEVLENSNDKIDINLSRLLYGFIPTYNLDKPKVLFPITIKGILRNHIVLLAFDKEKKQILFFDSKGYTLQDHFSSQLLIQSKFPEVKTVGDLLNYIVSTKGLDLVNEWSIVNNTQKIQKDTHNCGVYVADCMKRIAENEEFKGILKAPLSFSEADNSAREKLMGLLDPSTEDSVDFFLLNKLYLPHDYSF
ncbi:MAG: hypothetical protein COT84_07255 [Chlamydiae bacterium CG10_big_fil_rev_8_21_14_0_10_35_9]|nr:MAG: hypothetical protein COT84_07255 [Chlamydiae bacterium CG10_big_fil_rev_8_21_14_0_10_35_9]